MSNRVFTSDLSVAGINKLIKQLQTYESDLDLICDKIVRRLAEIGIKVAEYSVASDWRDCIEFMYIPLKSGAGNLTGWDAKVIHRVWYTSKRENAKKREADVSPLLMSEYGAGWYALNGHRGTFPGQKHAFQSEWFWYDANGTKHSSEEDSHMIATQPMYRALVEMMNKAENVVKEVFNEYGNE